MYFLAIPDPIVVISTSDLSVAGQNFSLTCTVNTTVDRTGQLTVNWVRNGDMTILRTTSVNLNTASSTILTLPFSPLTFTDRGMYSCVVEFRVPVVALLNVSDSYNLIVDCETQYFHFPIDTINLLVSVILLSQPNRLNISTSTCTRMKCFACVALTEPSMHQCMYMYMYIRIEVPGLICHCFYSITLGMAPCMLLFSMLYDVYAVQLCCTICM